MSNEGRKTLEYAVGMGILNATLSTDGDERRYFLSGMLEMGIGLTRGNENWAKTQVRIEIP
ncbi:hypothetical protein HYZ97_02110 [Candidatus Pacearchaeota archaeon]|nr:hypothetical protein [Candidatus Pacearchaeota archaeon]